MWRFRRPEGEVERLAIFESLFGLISILDMVTDLVVRIDAPENALGRNPNRLTRSANRPRTLPSYNGYVRRPWTVGNA